MTEAEASSLKHAARMTFDKSMDVIVDVFLPLGTGIIGLAAGAQTIGGTYSIANALLSVSSSQNTRLGSIIAAGIFAVVGLAFWRLGHSGGLILKAIGKGAGAFFIGTGIQAAIYAAKNTVAPQGALDSLFSQAQAALEA